jgi:hypothetical protein
MENEAADTPATESASSDAPLTMDAAVEAYLGKQERSPAKDDAQPAAADTPSEPTVQESADTEQAAEADVQDAQEADTGSDEYEFDLAGHKFKFSKESVKDVIPQVQAKAKELEAGSTRKFQEAAEARKAAESFQSLVAQNVDLFAEARYVHGEMQRLQSIDFNALTDADPVQALKLQNSFMQLQGRANQLNQSIQQASSQIKAQQDEQRTKAVSEVRTYAQSSIKGWTPDLDKALGEYVSRLSVKPDSVQSLTTDPRMYEVLVKAYKYDALQSGKPLADKKVATASPAVKPNSANNTVTSAQVRAKDAWGRFEKSGRMDDAVEAYLSRQRTKGR